MIVLAMLSIDEGSVQVCEQSKAEILLVTTCLGLVATTPTKRRVEATALCYVSRPHWQPSKRIIRR